MEGMGGMVATAPEAERRTLSQVLEAGAQAPPAAAVAWRHNVEVAAAILVALALALALPLATTVFALILFGVLHNYFEIRYVLGRFDHLLAGRIGQLVLVGLTLIVLTRLVGAAPLARTAEIVAMYVLLAGVLSVRLRGHAVLLASGLAVLLAALGLSLAFADLHFVVITHLHNVLPLVFLWEWTARGCPSAARRPFWWLQIGWVLAIPLLVLAGAFDGLALPDLTVAARVVGDVEAFVRGLTPPGGDSLLASRLLVMFAFLQLMHYYVWCRFFPAVGGAEAARTDRVLAELGLPHGRRLTLAALALAGLTAAVLWSDFRLGRSLYGALAGYHAYLEYALLLLFALPPRGNAGGGCRGRRIVAHRDRAAGAAERGLRHPAAAASHADRPSGRTGRPGARRRARSGAPGDAGSGRHRRHAAGAAGAPALRTGGRGGATPSGRRWVE